MSAPPFSYGDLGLEKFLGLNIPDLNLKINKFEDFQV